MNLLKEIKPDALNLSMYKEREGTIAAKMKQMPERFRKERSRIMTGEFRKIQMENNRKWIGWEGKVLINEKGKISTPLGVIKLGEQILNGLSIFHRHGLCHGDG